jgi:hypothetical protein
MPEIYIVKANGEREIFDYKKLETSLKKSGANEVLIKEILLNMSAEIKDGMTTAEIYKKAYSFLKKNHRPTALRYSLKKAVAQLGPTGFPFEKFVAEIFKANGYETETNRIVKGKCVEHEIDVIAWKEGELIMIEAKFHTDFGLKSDLKIALYVKARYDDIFGEKYVFGGKERQLTEGWIVTNTKFSSMAIQYDQCQPQLKLVGWNYPYGNNLHNMIEKAELIPLTALTSITTAEKNMFLSRGIVLSKSLLDEKLLRDLNFDDIKIKKIFIEINDLCEHCRVQFKK